MRRLLIGTLTAFVALSACTSNGTTSPELVPDSSLTFDTAHARWVATQPTAYSFEFVAQNAMVPSPGFARATVSDGRVIDVRLAQSGDPMPLAYGFTIDQLWDRLIAAKARGDALTELQYSREGIPIQATVGDFASDGGTRYQLRAFEQAR